MKQPGLDIEIVGEGRDLVLLHSLLSDRGSYYPLARRLAGERRSILVNMPGYGASPPAAPTLAAYADKVVELFDELALPPATDLLGNGFGGFVALTLAGRHGERFDRLVLVGSAVAFPDAGKAIFKGLAGKVERDGMASVAGAAMQRMLPADFIAANPAVMADREAAFKRIDPLVFAGACRMLAGLDLSPELARVRNRTLIIAGPKDGATPPALGRELAGKLAHAEMIEMPGVGHAPHLEQTDAFIGTIAAFLGLKTSANATGRRNFDRSLGKDGQ